MKLYRRPGKHEGHRTSFGLTLSGAVTLAAATGLILIGATAQTVGATAAAPGQPSARCLGKDATIVGSDRDDVIQGTERRDVIAGLGGNDTIDGLGAADTICGGDGNDVITPGEPGEGYPSGSDVVSGGADNDTFREGQSFGSIVSFEQAPGPIVVDLVRGRATGWGDDRIESSFAVEGSRFSDSIAGDDSINFLSGGPGDDRILAADGQDFLDGGPGDDLLDGGKARPRSLRDETQDYVNYSEAPRGILVNLASGLARGWGNDRLAGIEGIEGSRYADRLVGGTRTDVFYGLAGDDVLLGRGAGDYLQGGDGDDLLIGAGGHDTLRGDGVGRRGIGLARPGNDRLRGGPGNDDLAGWGGRDVLEGGPGADRLGEGDSGNDTIDGGPGADWAVFEFAPRRVVASLVSGRAVGDGQDRLVSIERLIGSRFSDRLFGGPGSTTIYGRGGADLVFGAGGNDDLFGEEGSDRIFGGLGRDALDGGTGRDGLDGGPGRDRCTTGERNRSCP
jgi:Ca2+-binding RTX toxin-like protein